MKDYKALCDKQKELIEHIKSWKSDTLDWHDIKYEIESELSALESEEHELIVPSEEDINKWVDKVQPVRGGYKTDYVYSAKWAIEQIKKLNK